LQQGSDKRRTAATLMNKQSSRSHSVFSVTVHQKEHSVSGEELVKIGKLYLVDLAGSENVGRSGATGARGAEAGNINKSLLALGRVIAKLVQRESHIPYRESKLTRLLQDSLGGRTKTSIIATVSPAFMNMEETMSTLDYAARAKNILNKPEVNQKLSKKTLIKDYTQEIMKLKLDLLATREKNGVYLSAERYTEMQAELEELNTKVIGYTEESKKLTTLFEEASASLAVVSKAREVAETELVGTKATLVETAAELEKTTVDRDNHAHIVSEQVQTEEALKREATDLIEMADTTTVHISELHAKIDRKSGVVEHNHTVAIALRDSLDVKFSEMRSAAEGVANSQLIQLAAFEASAADIINGQLAATKTLTEKLATFGPEASVGLTNAKALVADYAEAASVEAAVQSASVEAAGSKIANETMSFSAVHFAECSAAMHAMLASQAESLKSMQSMMASFFAEQNSTVQAFVAGHDLQLSALREMTAAELAAKAGALESQKSQLAKVTAEQQTSAADAMSKVQDQIASLLSGFVAKQASSLSAATTTVGDQVGIIAAETMSFAGKADAQFASVCKTTAAFSNEYATESTDNTHMANEAADGISAGLDQVDTSITNAASLVGLNTAFIAAKVTAHVQAVQGGASARAANAVAFAAMHDEAVTVASGSVAALVSNSEMAATTVDSAAESQQGAINTYSLGVQEAVKTSLVETTSSSKEVLGSVHKFVNQDRKEDVATGRTPMRQPYEFTREISFTRPHSQLITEFRTATPAITEEDGEDACGAGESGAAPEATVEGTTDSKATKAADKKVVGVDSENPAAAKVAVSNIPSVAVKKALGTINA